MNTVIHSDTQIGLVRLRVHNLTRSVEFYQSVIGLNVLKREEKTAYLSANGHTVLVEIEEHVDAVRVQPRTTTGLYHFALLVPTRKDLGVILQHLLELKMDIGQSDHYVSEALYLSDPDGNGIEIYADRPRSTWKRDASNHYVMGSDPIMWRELLDEAKGEQWSGLPQETIIGHIHLHVSDLELAKDFYVEKLGFEVVGDFKAMRALFIAAGGYHHHIGLNVWAGIGAPNPPKDAIGLVYYTIILPNSTVRNDVIKRLDKNGIDVKTYEDFYVITDPFGIEIRLACK
ncbi:VOC family protein [Alkalihalophilus sp. As8PL]|uniref:VOC family protein n=1 Tax=Alkalihalophilus sp. As8PL TaxID=3237103 RepID=A0AB39BNA7_9BACI